MQIRRASDHNVRTAIRLCNPHRTRETNDGLPGSKSGRQETRKPGNDLPVGTRSKLHSCLPYFLPSCFSSFEADMRSLGVKGVSGMPHVSGFWFRPKDGLGVSRFSQRPGAKRSTCRQARQEDYGQEDFWSSTQMIIRAGSRQITVCPRQILSAADVGIVRNEAPCG
jgi:hypothetical protein